MGLANGEQQQETKRQEGSEAGCASPRLLPAGLPRMACVFPLQAAALLSWELSSLGSEESW